MYYFVKTKSPCPCFGFRPLSRIRSQRAVTQQEHSIIFELCVFILFRKLKGGLIFKRVTCNAAPAHQTDLNIPQFPVVWVQLRVNNDRRVWKHFKYDHDVILYCTYRKWKTAIWQNSKSGRGMLLGSLNIFSTIKTGIREHICTKHNSMLMVAFLAICCIILLVYVY